MDVSLEAVGAEEVGDIALNFIQRCIALVKEARCQREQRNVHIAQAFFMNWLMPDWSLWP